MIQESPFMLGPHLDQLGIHIQAELEVQSQWFSDSCMSKSKDPMVFSRYKIRFLWMYLERIPVWKYFYLIVVIELQTPNFKPDQSKHSEKVVYPQTL